MRLFCSGLMALTVACSGAGTIGIDLAKTEVFVDANPQKYTEDNDNDGLVNILDNCANTPSAGDDADDDGLGTFCDPHPGIADYATPSCLGGPPAAMQCFLQDNGTDPPPEPPPGEPYSVSVQVVRVCRGDPEGFTFPMAENPIVEVTSSTLALEPGERDEDEEDGEGNPGPGAVTVFGMAPVVLAEAFPILQVLIEEPAQLHAQLGEIDNYARYARFCDDKNLNDGCDQDEPLLDAWLGLMFNEGEEYDEWEEEGVSEYANAAAYVTVNSVSGGEGPKGKDPECDAEVGSPLILDVAGDGISLSDYAARFDLDANGTEDLVSWLGGLDDAFLALDVDGNGVISSGAELFGNHTLCGNEPAANGFDALAQYDENDDDLITAADSIYGSLRLWTDDNRDGRSQSDELFTLEARNITAISVSYVNVSETDQYGNETRQRSFFLRGGETALVVDAWLRVLNLQP